MIFSKKNLIQSSYRFLFSISLLLLTTSLNAAIENQFKKCENKNGNYNMKNIDFIYLINLDQREEKLQQTLEQLTPYNIKPYRFSAVNGWKLTLEQINDVGVKFTPGMTKGMLATSYLNEDLTPTHGLTSKYGQVYFGHCTARGTIGCFLSHASILQDAYDSGYETIWVMEDDIDIKQDPRKLSGLIEELDKLVGRENWDILFTDRDIKDRNGKNVPCSSAAEVPNFNPKKPNRYSFKKNISKNFRKIGARYATTSMIFSKSGIKKLLDFIKEHSMFLPIDMTYTLPLGINLYTVRRDVVTNLSDAKSDNGKEGYLKK